MPEPFEVAMKRLDARAPDRWFYMGTPGSGVGICAGRFGEETVLFHGEWDRCLEAAMVTKLRNHAGPLADLVAAARRYVRNGCVLEDDSMREALAALDQVTGRVEDPNRA